jgi:hypothetical protein
VETMMQATIHYSTDLINGGCNACPTVKTTSYSLTLGQLNTPLENLDVSSLVMAIVLNAGFRQELVLDFMDEYVAFQRDGKKVQFLEEYGKSIYKSDEKEIVCMPSKDHSVIFHKANEVLTEIFELKAVEFTLAE